MDQQHLGVGNLKIKPEEVISDAFDYFTPPKVINDVIATREVIVAPEVLKDYDGPLEFKIKSLGDQYISLHDIELFMRLQIKKSGDSNLDAVDMVAPVQLIANSMFSNIAIDINGQPVSDLTNMYSNYKGYMETIMSFGRDAIAGHLRSAMFFDDGPDLESTAKYADTTNKTPMTGYQKRVEIVKGSAIFETRLRPSSDLLSIRKPMPPNVDITMRFTRADDKWCLMTDEATKTKDCRIKILKAELCVKYKTLQPQLHNNIMSKWKGNQIYLPMVKTTAKTYIFSSGLQNIQASINFNYF